MPRTGVVIGKFYPPHRGHKYLIDVARSQVERLTVIVCDKADQAIPAALRAAWLREIHPEVTVVVVPDDLPAGDSRAWAQRTIDALGYRPDVVFTSEAYGDAYARYVGCRHVAVDARREHVPVSATAIRADPLAYWEFLEPCVRAHFAVRVSVVGAESTGTTAMARALAEHYRTVWVPEFGRLYWEARRYARDAGDWRSEEFLFIAREQCRLEDALARRCNGLLFCDTDAFATGIWHERYVGSRSAAVEAIGKGRIYALYLLTDIDIPFVQDGTRDGERIRPWMHERFRAELPIRSARYEILSGDHAQRLARAVVLVDAIAARRTVPAEQIQAPIRGHSRRTDRVGLGPKH